MRWNRAHISLEWTSWLASAGQADQAYELLETAKREFEGMNVPDYGRVAEKLLAG